MSMNPVALKIATPYARTLYTIAKEADLHIQIGNELKIFSAFLKTNESRTFKKCLNNPLLDSELKYNIISVVFKKLKGGRRVRKITAEFIAFLINRKRINILEEVLYKYKEIVDTLTLRLDVTITTVYPADKLAMVGYSSLLAKLMKLNRVTLFREIDENLIAGVSLKTESKILDLSIRNQLQKLAKHLNASLEI